MVRLEVNIRDYLRSMDAISEKMAEAIVRGVAWTALQARDDVRQKTRAAFTLRSDYIPQSIRSMPHPGRAKAIAGATKGLLKRRKFKGAVYLKGSNNPKKSLAFLVDHELGSVRKPVDGRLAVPLGVQRYRFRGSKGAVLRRWKPAALLAYYNRTGPGDAGSKKYGKRRRGKPKAFVLRGQIVRRKTNKSRELEVLYSFAKQARLKRRWGFVETARGSIQGHIGKMIVSEINKLRV